MPPSPTSGGPSARRSRNRLTVAFHHGRRRTVVRSARVRRAAHRNGDVPLHGRRGIDPAARGARRGGLRRRARPAPGDRARRARRARRCRGGHAGRRVLLRVRHRHAQPSRARPRSRTALAAGPVRVRIGVHTGEALVVDRHYVGHGRASRRAHRCLRARRAGRALAVDGGLARARASSSFATSVRIGSRTSPRLSSSTSSATRTFPPLKALFRTNLPVPATPFLGREEELAELVALRIRAGRSRADAHRSGRHRQDAAGAAARGGARRTTTRTASGGCRSHPLRDGALVASAVASALDVEEESGRELTSTRSRARSRASERSCCRQLRAPRRLGRRRLVADGSRASCPDVSRHRDEPRGAGGSGRARLRRSSRSSTTMRSSSSTRARGRPGHASTRGRRAAVVGSSARGSTIFPSPSSSRRPARGSASRRPPRAAVTRLRRPRRASRRRRASAHAASDDRVELRPARGARAAALPAPRASSWARASLSGDRDACAKPISRTFSRSSPRASFVRRLVESDEPRYFMLETIREFAAEELASVRRARCDCRDRHVRWFADRRPRAGIAELERADSGERLARLELDLANLRAAFAWTDERPSAARTGSRSPSHSARGTSCAGGTRRPRTIVRRALVLEPESLDAAVLYGSARRQVLRLAGSAATSRSTPSARPSVRSMRSPIGNDAWWERWLDVELDLAHVLLLRERPGRSSPSSLRTLEPLVGAARHARPAARPPAPPRPASLPARALRAVRGDRGARPGDVPDGRASWRDVTSGLHARVLPPLAREARRGGRVPRARARGRTRARLCAHRDALPRLRRHRTSPTERRRRGTGARAGAGCTGRAPRVPGLTVAVAAWVAYRDGDHGLAAELGTRRSPTGCRRGEGARVSSRGRRGSRSSVSSSSGSTQMRRSTTRRQCFTRLCSPFLRSSRPRSSGRSGRVPRTIFVLLVERARPYGYS